MLAVSPYIQKPEGKFVRSPPEQARDNPLTDLMIPEVEISGEDGHAVRTGGPQTREAVSELLLPGVRVLLGGLQVSVQQRQLQGADVGLKRRDQI